MKGIADTGLLVAFVSLNLAPLWLRDRFSENSLGDIGRKISDARKRWEMFAGE